MTRIALAALFSGLLLAAVVCSLPAAESNPRTAAIAAAPTLPTAASNPTSDTEVRFVTRKQGEGEGGMGQDDEYDTDEADTEETTEGAMEESTEQDSTAKTQDKSDKKEPAADTKDAKSDSTEKSDEKSDAKSDTKTDAKSGPKPDAKADDKTPPKTDKPAEKPAAKPAPKKRKTFKVEPKRLKIEVPLDGTFVARKMEEVVLRPEAWSGYEIKEIVEHGAKVRRGQTLVKFDDERINQAIEDMELDQRLSELAIERAEQDLPRQERVIALNLENAERNNKETKDDYARFNEIDRPLLIKQVENNLKKSKYNLAYETDELNQLEKMYKADDLTEETEEIVLKRQKDLVEFATFNLEAAKTDHDELLNILLPRYEIQMKQSLEAAEMSLSRAKMANAIDLPRGRYNLEQSKQARIRSTEKHTKLLKDRDLMELKAPADGIVYYGQCVDGRWSDMASLINRLHPHNNVSAGTVVMTIIEQRPLYVTASVDEAKRPEISAGQKVKIAPPADGSPRIDGKVEKVSPVPTGSGRFALEFALEQDAVPDWVVAGMSCKTRVTSYDKADALAVPKIAVRTDEEDEDKKYVWLVDQDDEEAKPTRRNVTVGKASGNDIEIVKGLKKGDVVSLEDESGKPKEE